MTQSNQEKMSREPTAAGSGGAWPWGPHSPGTQEPVTTPTAPPDPGPMDPSPLATALRDANVAVEPECNPIIFLHASLFLQVFFSHL